MTTPTDDGPAGAAADGSSGPGARGAAPAADGAPGTAGAHARRTVERALRDRDPVEPPGASGPVDRHAAVALVLRPPAAPAGAPASVRGLPLAPGLGGLEALFIVRVERDGDPWSGHVGLPGGHAEAVDADLADAALRELEEETGLALDRAALLGRMEELRPRSRRLPSVAVTPFVAWHGGPDAVDAGPEVAGHFWTELAALEDPGRRTILTVRRDGAYRVFPGVEHEAGVIWGLTFVILRRFLGLLPRGPGSGPGSGPGEPDDPGPDPAPAGGG